MITLSEIVEKKLNQSTFLADGLLQDLMNYSAVARMLQPEIAEEYYKDVTEGAIVMALRRHIDGLQKKLKKRPTFPIRNITVRSRLVEYVFANDASLNAVHRRLAKMVEDGEDIYLNYAQGVFETTIIMSSELDAKLQKLTEHLTPLAYYSDLSSITIRLPDDTADTSGVYYPFFRVLAWADINFIEIISVYSELTFVLEDKHIDRAFSLIQSLAGAKA